MIGLSIQHDYKPRIPFSLVSLSPGAPHPSTDLHPPQTHPMPRKKAGTGQQESKKKRLSHACTQELTSGCGNQPTTAPRPPPKAPLPDPWVRALFGRFRARIGSTPKSPSRAQYPCPARELCLTGTRSRSPSRFSIVSGGDGRRLCKNKMMKHVGRVELVRVDL